MRWILQMEAADVEFPELAIQPRSALPPCAGSDNSYWRRRGCVRSGAAHRILSMSFWPPCRFGVGSGAVRRGVHTAGYVQI
jgi:hypothetical protein